MTRLLHCHPRRPGHILTVFFVIIAALLVSTVIQSNIPSFAAPVEVGYVTFSYGTASHNAPTGEKPESKLWYNDGLWWGSLFNATTEAYHIYRFDAENQSWQDTGVQIDIRNGTKADTLWDQATQKLYIASHDFTTNAVSTTSSGGWGRLYRFSYSIASQTYTLDAGFPITITRGRSETLTIAKDSTGRLWATYVENRTVMVNHSLSSDSDWATPYALPAANTSVSSDDISSIIALPGNKIAIVWSNQIAAGMFAAIHNDGSADNQWQLETIVQGSNEADDHINLKVDSNGRLFVAAKTGKFGSDPLVVLYVRSTNGTWATYTYSTGNDGHTRPIVMIDEGQNMVYVFATSDDFNFTGKIYVKSSSLNNISFPPGMGTIFIQDLDSPTINNASSTKQNVSSAIGMLVIASNHVNQYYYHNDALAGISVPDPTPTPTATDTPLPTATDTPLPTATDTPLPTATDTPLPTATDTPLPTATDTPLPTATDTPLPTATDTPLPTATDTPLPTATDTPLPTATDTPLPTATDTPLPTATDTPLPTATDTPLPTATDTPLPTATDTPLPTATDTPLPTATDTPLPTATDTLLPTATDTPLPTATDTPLPTATDTPLPTATDTPLPTATDTPLPTATDTPLPTATDTPLPTATDTPLPTATDTPLPTATDTPLPTATDTPLPTATDTPLPTATDTPLPTATSTQLPTVTPTPMSGTFSLLPVEDTYVSLAQPSAIYGDQTSLSSTESLPGDDIDIYLKFEVPTIAGPVTRATLRLFAYDSSNDSGSIYVVANTYQNSPQQWTEEGLYWNNAPRIQGGAVTSGSSVGKNKWVEVDITSAITAAGTYSFAISSSASNTVYYYSKENSRNRPELVIEVGSGSQANQRSFADTSQATSNLMRVESDSQPVRQNGTWISYTTDIASGGSYIYSGGTTADSLELGFYGSQIEIIYLTHQSLGSFVVEIDGWQLQVVNEASSEINFGVKTVINGLAESNHLLRVYPSGGTIAIDAFGVEALAPIPALMSTSTPQIGEYAPEATVSDGTIHNLSTPMLAPTAALPPGMTLMPTLTPTLVPVATATPLPPPNSSPTPVP